MKSTGRILWIFILLTIVGGYDPGLTGAASGCVEGNGKPTTVERPAAPFRAVNIDGAFEVVFVFGKNTELSLTAEDNLLPHIVTEVRNDTLFINPGRSICATSAMKVRVGTDCLEKVLSQGSNDIWLEQVSTDSLAIEIDGSGTVKASGGTNLFSIDIRGSAEVWARDLKAESVQIDISGAGDAEVFASKTIRVDISGAGTVVYHGHPAEVTQEISGAGELIPR